MDNKIKPVIVIGGPKPDRGFIAMYLRSERQLARRLGLSPGDVSRAEIRGPGARPGPGSVVLTNMTREFLHAEKVVRLVLRPGPYSSYKDFLERGVAGVAVEDKAASNSV